MLLPHTWPSSGLKDSDIPMSKKDKTTRQSPEAPAWTHYVAGHLFGSTWQGTILPSPIRLTRAPWCLPIIPIGSMPGGLPGIDRSPGVVLVPGVGASFLGVGVLDLSPGVEDLSF